MKYDEADDMCPNCCTPWECYGPHLEEETPFAMRRIELQSIECDAALARAARNPEASRMGAHLPFECGCGYHAAIVKAAQEMTHD